jgi:hypothetical protein
MDFCLHDVRRNGGNAIERFLAKSPLPPESDEKLILRGKREARYSLFMVEATEPGVGVRVRDLHYDEEAFITDVGFSTSAEVALVMAFRLMTVDGIKIHACLQKGVASRVRYNDPEPRPRPTPAA